MGTKKITYTLLSIVAISSTIIGWQSYKSSDMLALQLASFPAFQKLQAVEDIMVEEISLQNRKNKNIIRKFKHKDYQYVITDNRLSTQEKDRKLSDMGMEKTNNYRTAAAQVPLLISEIRNEFPQLYQLEKSDRIVVFKKAVRIYRKNHPIKPII